MTAIVNIECVCVQPGFQLIHVCSHIQLYRNITCAFVLSFISSQTKCSYMYAITIELLSALSVKHFDSTRLSLAVSHSLSVF